MCGIWLRTRYSESVDSSELLFPVQVLSHRGPDGYGWWKDDKVAMIHTRLSINDLSGGTQPLQSFDKKWIGIVNGEIYDFRDLRKSLIKRGISFKTQSDSEVLLNLYAIDGAEGLKNISGEFSFIFYNPLSNQIHFGRDLHGVKPLFFESREKSFTLASEMKALQNEKPTLDPEYLKTFLARSVVPPHTCLENVSHVWPGRVYSLDLNTRKITWKCFQALPLFQTRHLSGPEAIEALDFELRSSVKRRLEADVEVGCYLSGGIDSAMIAAIAKDVGAKPKAFTVGFADGQFDESRAAANIAQDLGLDHHIVQMNSKNFMESLIQSIVAFENPIANPHGAAKNLLASLASKHVKVVLSGEGSDEWFGGYAYFRIKKLKNFISKHPHLAKGSLSHFMRLEMESSLRHLDGQSETYHELSAKFFEGKSPMLLGRMPKMRYYRHIVGENLDSKMNFVCASLQKLLSEENPTGHYSEWDLDSWMSIRTDLLHYILSNVGDRQEMSHSLEGRTPFLDINVTRIIGQIKTNTLMRGLNEKDILRNLGKRYLKSEHSQRTKKPFFAPMKYLYLKENQSVIRDFINIAREETPWLQWKNIDHLIFTNKRSYRSGLEGHRISLILILFSIGVLVKNLRQLPMRPRGYQLPENLQDLNFFQRTF